MEKGKSLCEKILTMSKSDKGLISRAPKKHYQINWIKTGIQSKNSQRIERFKRQNLKVQKASKETLEFSSNNEMKNKTTAKCHFSLIRWPKN